MTHICVSNLTIIGSDNGLSLGRHEAIIWTNAEILSFEPLGTSFSEILIKIQNIFIHENAFENVVWKMATILSRVLKYINHVHKQLVIILTYRFY